MIRAALLAGVLICTVSGCHREQKAAGHGTVSGQILPGSVSDAMLPYDALKSQAPLAPVQPSEVGDNTPDNSADSAASAESAETPPPDAAASAGSPVSTGGL